MDTALDRIRAACLTAGLAPGTDFQLSEADNHEPKLVVSRSGFVRLCRAIERGQVSGRPDIARGLREQLERADSLRDWSGLT